MTTKTIEEEALTPVYLSIGKLDKLMELVIDRSLSNISKKYFVNYGFGPSDASLAFGGLRFLGLVDQDGNSTELMKKIKLRGDAGKKEIQNILKNAYRKLFAVTGESGPQNLSLDDLVNELITQYNISPRIAKPAATAFLKLCEYGGLREAGTISGRIRENRREKTTKNSPKVTRRELNRSDSSPIEAAKEKLYSIPVVNGKTGWWLPTEIFTRVAFEIKIAEDIQSITSKISEFSQKYCGEDKLSVDTDK